MQDEFDDPPSILLLFDSGAAQKSFHLSIEKNFIGEASNLTTGSPGIIGKLKT